MLPATSTEIFNIIMSLRDNTAVGVDQISVKIIKRYVHILVEPVTHICNMAMSTGQFPVALKRAVIKLIHKSGSKDCINNYRPISILPTLSKILERLMNKRLVNFLEANNLLAPSQYGFRRGRSTKDAVQDLVDSAVSCLDQKTRCLTVFLDLAKAFDTVPISRLLVKLEKIGVRGIPYRLFEDYLTNRSQRVKIQQWLSDESTTEYGIPQGSVVGPTLFLIYVNDLCQLHIHGGKILTFADDTALFFSGSSWSEVFDSAQKGFNMVNQWLRSNLLTLNVSKTKLITFAPRSNLLPSANYFIKAHVCEAKKTVGCRCPIVDRTNAIKYLGVNIDQTLSFRPHLEALVMRLRKMIYIFRKLRHVADRRIIKIVYSALCQPLIDYCVTAWGGAPKSNLIEVERAQRTILKVGAGLPFLYPTCDLYKNWEILTVRQTFILNIVLRKHSQLSYVPGLVRDKRRKGNICERKTLKTSLSHKFYGFLGNFLYNKLNTKLDIYHLRLKDCKSTVSEYLKSLDYHETEDMLHTLK